MKKLILMMAASVALISSAAQAKSYVADVAKSTVTFAGTHADNPFTGNFKNWTMEIDFDPEHLDKSSLKGSFDLVTAKTGVAMYDGTLPQEDWFNIAKFPRAVFSSSAITSNGKGGYTAKGDLALRGVVKPVSFDFTLSDLAATPVKAKGSLVINRLDFEIGKKSDATAEWVSKEITINFDVTATPAKQ